MPLILPGNVASAIGAGYEVANSCRFNGSNSSLSKTVGDAAVTNAAFSCWFKRSVIGANQTIYATDSSNEVRIKIHSDDKLDIYSYTDDYQYRLQTNRLFRDPAAWYHLVIRVDTTNGTADNRIRVYINGTQETSFAARTNPGSSDNIEWFQGSTGYIGISEDGSSNPFDGYLAEIVMVDGSTTAHTVFGEFDEDSPTIWKPINVSSLSVGTNGWYLDFEASDNLGNAVDGGTDWTENNLAAVDQATDTPTNNFCTLNPLSKGPNVTLSEGNLKVAKAGVSYESCMATIMPESGRWYFEAKMTAGGVFNVSITKATQNGTVHAQVDAGRIAYSSNGNLYDDGGDPISDTGTTFTDDDIIGVYLDLESSTQAVHFHKNGSAIVSRNLGDSYSGYTGGWSPAFGLGGDTTSGEINFGSPMNTISSGNADANGYGNFEHSPTISSVNYYALNTKNLAEFG